MANRPPTQAELEAAHWIEVLDAPNVPRHVIEDFQAWLAASEEHKRAYAAVSATSDKIDAFLRLEGLGAANDHGVFYVDQTALRQRRNRKVGLAMLAAGVVAIGLISTLTPLSPFGERTPYEAAASEARIIDLADGSRIELAPGGRAVVSFSGDARRVRLHEGVALFNVAHDATRPFIVVTDFGEIRVTGTEFVVRLGEDRAITTVLSGRVEARRPSLLGRSLPDAVGTAETEIVLDREGATALPLRRDVVEQRLLWRQRMVALDGQSLREATLEIERFTGVRFVFADDELGEIALNGYIAGDDVEGFLRLLRTNVGIEGERRADGAIVLGYAS